MYVNIYTLGDKQVVYLNGHEYIGKNRWWVALVKCYIGSIKIKIKIKIIKMLDWIEGR